MITLKKLLNKPWSLFNAYKIEREHQTGRRANWRTIIADIKDRNLQGDFIEFGSYKGQSLSMIQNILWEYGMKRTLIGIDSFAGLEEDEFPFKKGWFTDTSKEICQQNAPGAFVEQFRFAEKDAILARLKDITDQKFCFIHIDCDLSNAAKDIFEFLPQIMTDECYLLFDDYGVMESYKNTVDELLGTLQGFQITEHSHTNLTKNFLLKKI